jgi:hypothetical protein
MYSTNSAALTLATAASSSAAAQASAVSGRSLCTPDFGRRIRHRRGILRAIDNDDPPLRPHDPDRGPRALPPRRLGVRGEAMKGANPRADLR